MHFKCPKNGPCLWFGRFSSRVKRCTRVRLQRFTRELKRPNQRQGAFLRHLKCTNHPGYEAQSCSTQKVGFSKWRLFFDSMHFRPWPLPSGGFLKKPTDKVLIFLLKTIYFIIKILNLHHYFTPNFFLVDLDYFDTVARKKRESVIQKRKIAMFVN